MSRLSHALFELERELRDQGVVVAEHFHNGVSDSMVIERLAELDLTASSELIDWFAWHDGAGDPDSGLLECELAPGVYLWGLDLLCSEYREIRRDLATASRGTELSSGDLWNPCWFPIARLDAGCVAVDLTDHAAESSPVLVRWFDAPPGGQEPHWTSVRAFITTLTGRYAEGVYEVGVDGMVSGPDVDRA